MRASLPNPNHRLLPGMFATIDIAAGGAEQHITLPQTAITYNPYGSTVYLVEKNADTGPGQPALIARQSFVTTGTTRGDQVAVLSGVKPGDTVVSAGQIKLHNGAPVVVNNKVQTADNPAPIPVDR
jgi:membrane fusion protein (multidrug efflux system)